MKRIIAIGGGEIRDGDTLPIDKYILEATGKDKPNLLFLPTASGDAEGYWEIVNKVFGIELGAATSVLKLTQNPTDSEIQDKIGQADAIYVGGGNTRKMLDIWKSREVDKLLLNAYESGVVLSGLSAGAICWFEYGSTDSPKFDNPDDTNFVLIEGLGLVGGLASPHHIREPKRMEVLPDLVKKTGSVGFGIDDCAAIEIVEGEQYKVISSKAGVGITKVSLSKNGDTVIERILPNDNYQLYSELFKPR